MDMTVRPAQLRGTVTAIGSKSDAHRLMICAALAEGVTVLKNVPRSNDIEATANCLTALGASVEFDHDVCTIHPLSAPADAPALNCGESGTTFRFMLPVAAAVCDNAEFSGAGRLPHRPIGALVAAMEENGVTFSDQHLPFGISGRLRSGEYVLPGNVSSQYVSGLLIALAQVPGKSVIRLSSRLESAPYVAMTIKTLRLFGADVTASESGYAIFGGRLHSPGRVRVEGDWSNAAFFLAAGALGDGLSVIGLDTASVQGDREIVGILGRFGADVGADENGVSVHKGVLRGCDVDLAETPDLLPILAVVAANAEGESRFINGARLRLKESDRLKTVCALIRALGGGAEELPDGLVVRGGVLTGGQADGAGDHRIVMAAAIAAACGGGPVTICGAEAVAKSYPTFFEELTRLGGKADVV